MKVKLLELFSGYGSQRLSFERLGYEVDSVISEIDKNAINVYNEIHGNTLNLGDIKKISKIKEQFDVWTYSFPCTDLSTAGTMDGLEGENSGLVFEVLRLLKNSDKPKMLIMENVTTISTKYRDGLELIKGDLKKLGYNNHEFILSGTDFGVPQRRKRFFMVSSLEDIDINIIPVKDIKSIEYCDIKYKEIKNFKNIGDVGISAGQYQPKIRDYNKLGLKREEWFEIRQDGLYNNVLTGRKKNMLGYIKDGKCYNRLLTPYETGQLMGLKKEEVKKMLNVSSENQVVKMHGNSIIIDVFVGLLKMIGY